MVSDFLDDLEQRGCPVSTRNHKLKSIPGIICLCLYDGYFACLILQGIGENSMEKRYKTHGG